MIGTAGRTSGASPWISGFPHRRSGSGIPRLAFEPCEERGRSATLTRGVDIDIYLTIRLRLVAHLCRWSLREGEG